MQKVYFASVMLMIFGWLGIGSAYALDWKAVPASTCIDIKHLGTPAYYGKGLSIYLDTIENEHLDTSIEVTCPILLDNTTKLPEHVHIHVYTHGDTTGSIGGQITCLLIARAHDHSGGHVTFWPAGPRGQNQEGEHILKFENISTSFTGLYHRLSAYCLLPEATMVYPTDSGIVRSGKIFSLSWAE